VSGTHSARSPPSPSAFCRLDNIVEPTLDDVIQASGSQVLQLVPCETSTCLSPLILFVQGHRHLIDN
jgi:hypothetical protein